MDSITARTQTYRHTTLGVHDRRISNLIKMGHFAMSCRELNASEFSKQGGCSTRALGRVLIVGGEFPTLGCAEGADADSVIAQVILFFNMAEPFERKLSGGVTIETALRWKAGLLRALKSMVSKSGLGLLDNISGWQPVTKS